MMPIFQSAKLGLINDLWAGCMAGMITLTVSVAMAALVFKGDLVVFLPAGIGMALIGAAVTGTVTNVCSAFKGTVAGPQSTSSIVIAIGASAVFSALAAEGDAAVISATLFGFFFASALAVGLTLFFLGRLGVGRWIRWMPQPVMRGILAGTGWLIIGNALAILENIAGSPALWRGEVSAVQLVNILTALLVGAAAFYLDQRQSHGMHRPTLFTAMFCAAALFLWWINSVMWLDEAASWRLYPLPADGILPSAAIVHLGLIRWDVVADQAWTIAALALITFVTIIFNVSNLELVTMEDADLDREIRAAGLGNTAASFFSGMVGYQMLSPSASNHFYGTQSRIAGLLPALLCLGVCVGGGKILALIPAALPGGYLLFVGFSFLHLGLGRSWQELKRADYLIVLVIFLACIATNLVTALVFGLLATLLAFVLNYSNVNLIKQHLSGRHHRSTVERPDRDHRFLTAQGHRIHIIRLQGYLFFGSVFKFYQFLTGLIERRASPDSYYLLLDFENVHGVDSSALHVLRKAVSAASRRTGAYWVLSPARPYLKALIPASARPADSPEAMVSFPDLDRALEWCEDHLLTSAAGKETAPCSSLLPGQLRHYLDPALLAQLVPYLQAQTFQQGDFLFRKGEDADRLYIVKSGELSVVLERQAASWVRYRKIVSGSVVGEMGFFLNAKRSASVIANTPCEVYALDHGRMKRLEARMPDVTAEFRNRLIKILSKRLQQKTNELTALLH